MRPLLHRLAPAGIAATLAGALALSAPGAAPAAGGDVRPFASVVRALAPGERAAMTPAAWRPGCPVHIRALRVVVMRHHDFGGRVRIGRLVVHNDVARDVVRAFARMYRARVPIRRMIPIERLGGDDSRSVDADNTSAFNCRTVAGTSRYSQHAYGRAIDINPRENPYVRSDGYVRDPAARPFIRRKPVRRGMAVEGGTMVRAFDALGWEWGGRWRGDLDYQHFSRDGG
ncbi:MAG: M15 family metallopeptidase [Miltoncostaeaceae bacterium]